MGIQINGQTDTISAVDNNFSLAGNVSIGGTLTYEDVTSVDSVGVITARSGIDAASNLLLKTGGSEKLRIDSSGRILVGTDTAPTAGITSSALFVVEGYTGVPTGDALISLQRGQAPASISSGAQLGGINFGASDGSRYAQIHVNSDGDSGTNDYPGRIIFSTTANSSATPTERLRISSDGAITATGNFTTGGSIISEANPEASNTTNGAMLDKVKVIARNATGQSVWLGYVNGTSATTSSITADGQANFSQRVFCNQWFQSERSSGTDSAFYGTVGGVEKLNIRANGSASFAGGACNIASDGKVRVGSGSATYNLEVQTTGFVETMIGSTNAGGAGIILDGDSNGDGSGGDYAQIFHQTDGTLNFRSRNPDGGTDTIFLSNTTETLRITAGGHVRINTGDLVVGETTDSNAGSQTISVGSITSGAGGIQLWGNPTNGNSFIQFGDGTASASHYRGYINYRHADDGLRFGTAGSDRVIITSDGSVGTGGLVATNGNLVVNSTIRSQNSSGNVSYIGFTQYTGDTTVGSMFSYMGGDGRNTGYLNFATNNAERMRIKSNGTIQFTPENGTAAPNASFDTSGDNFRINAKKDGSGGCGFIVQTQSGGALGERFRISQAGYVTKPNHPSFSVWNNSASSSAFSAMSVANWTVANTNIGNHFNFSNNRFVCPVAGNYYFCCQMLSNANTRLFYNLRKNGSDINGTYIETTNSSNSLYQTATMVAIEDAAANDYFEIYVRNNAAYGSSYSNFSGFLIG